MHDENDSELAIPDDLPELMQLYYAVIQHEEICRQIASGNLTQVGHFAAGVVRMALCAYQSIVRQLRRENSVARAERKNQALQILADNAGKNLVIVSAAVARYTARLNDLLLRRELSRITDRRLRVWSESALQSNFGLFTQPMMLEKPERQPRWVDAGSATEREWWQIDGGSDNWPHAA